MLLIQDLKLFNAGSEKVECAVCVKYVLKKRMRNHIGKHLVLKEVDPHPKNCGLCGTIGCSLEIVIPGRGKSAVATPYSDCKNFEKFSLGAAKKSSGLSPCTNVPINCEACKSKNVYWSYNMAAHYMNDHPSLVVPDCITTEEINKLKNLII